MGARADASETSTEFDQLYHAMWLPMVRLATGLVDAAAAEDIVQDAFAGLYQRWTRLDDPAAAAAYLRASVVNAARSVLRRRQTARKHLRVVAEETAEPADAGVVLSAEHDLVRAALAGLPDRQREVLTMRYLIEATDAEIADATGLSEGGVRSASSRGVAALRESLEGRL